MLPRPCQFLLGNEMMGVMLGISGCFFLCDVIPNRGRQTPSLSQRCELSPGSLYIGRLKILMRIIVSVPEFTMLKPNQGVLL